MALLHNYFIKYYHQFQMNDLLCKIKRVQKCNKVMYNKVWSIYESFLKRKKSRKLEHRN